MNTFFILSRSLAICLFSSTLSMMAYQKGNDSVTVVDRGTVDGLVGKNLRLTAVTSEPLIDMDGDGKLDSDLLPFLRPCDMDNTIRFEKEGKLSGSNGSIRCNENGNEPAGEKPGNWTYDNETNTLHLITKTTSGQTAADWEILESSATRVKAKVGAPNSSDPFRLIMTWKVD